MMLREQKTRMHLGISEQKFMPCFTGSQPSSQHTDELQSKDREVAGIADEPEEGFWLEQKGCKVTHNNW